MSVVSMLTPQMLQQQQSPQQQTIINWLLEDYAFFRKCGEITISSDLQCFGLNCLFCPGICLQVEVFMQHLREHHYEAIKALYGSTISYSNNNNNIDSPLNNYNSKKEQGTQTANARNGAPDMTSIISSSNNDDSGGGVGGAGGIVSLTDNYAGIDNRPIENAKEIFLSNWNWLDSAIDMDCHSTEATATTTSTALADVLNVVAIANGEDGIGHGVDVDDSREMQSTAAHQSAKEVNFVFVNSAEEDDSGIFSIEQLIEQVDDDDCVDDGEMANASPESFLIFKDKSNKGIDARDSPGQHDMPVISGNVASENVPMDTPTSDCYSAPETPRERRKHAKTSSVRQVQNNKEILTYLLELYRDNEKLWNPQNSDYKYNANRELYNELSAPLLRDMDCKLTGAEIFQILDGLRSRYRRELTKVKMRQGKYKSKFWAYEKLHFLHDIIEQRRAEREARNRLDSHAKPEYLDESHQVLSYLIEVYKREERLWNPHHKEYCKRQSNEDYEEISTQLKEDFNIFKTSEKCKQEIQHLVSEYRKELIAMRSKPKGRAKSKLWYFEKMDFLSEIIEQQLKQRCGTKSSSNSNKKEKQLKNSTSPIALDSVECKLKFIDIYRNYTKLWDVNHADFRSSKYRNEAVSQMLQEVNVVFEAAYTKEQLLRTLTELHREYSIRKQQQLLDTATTQACDGNETQRSSMPSVVFVALSGFLGPNVGPFRCEYCKEIIKTSDQYKIHKSSHDGSLPFRCALCGRGFQLPGNLSIHIRRHKRDFPYACEICDKHFATSTEVAIHRRSHTGERPYCCDLCGKSFKTWSFFDIHRRTHLQQSTFHCPICDKGFYERNRYTDHMNNHLNIRKHSCRLCGKTFTTLANLKKHEELHSSVKKYKCTICAKRFAQMASLRWHKRKNHHATDAPYEP